MKDETKIIYDNDSNDEANQQVRKDWRTLKKIIFKPNYLLVFIAISVLIIDLIILSELAPDFKKTSEQVSEASSTELSSEENPSEPDMSYSGGADDPKCNVIGINLHGELTTYIPKRDYNDSGNLTVDKTSSESIYFAVKQAENRDNIKAILVEVDSSGGNPVAAEEVEKILKSSTKPVIVYIREIGASAAYWAATGAQKIYAMPSSQVGSIAINSSYLDEVKLNQKDGYTFNELSTGKYKNIMNRNKPLTEDERALIMKDLNITHELFVKKVAENRALDINKVKEIANGWAYTGVEALQFGLIDELGGYEEARSYISSNMLNNEELNVCW